MAIANSLVPWSIIGKKAAISDGDGDGVGDGGTGIEAKAKTLVWPESSLNWTKANPEPTAVD